MSPSEALVKLEKDIKNSIQEYSKLLDNITKIPSSEVNEILWRTRADLETIVIELKSLLKDSMLKEKWQDKFHTENKGTKSKDKAISKLQEFDLNEQEILSLFSKDQNKCYQYLWKLKETISSVISAFPELRYKWVNNQLTEEKDKIFEI
jgi:hypothetical protein